MAEPKEPRLGTDIRGAFALSLVLILVAALIDNSVVAWLLAPGYVGGILYCLIKAPLRYSIFALMAAGFILENPNEMPACGFWQSPLFMVGSVMFVHIKNLTGVSVLMLSAMEYCVLILGLVALIRRATGSRIDRPGRAPCPDELFRFAQVSLLGALLVWGHGMATGGEFSKSLWQMEKVVYLPIVFMICAEGLRGPRDHVALGKVLLASALVRAALATYIRMTVEAPPDPYTGASLLAHATSHHDSMLFASAILLLIVLIVERAGRKAIRLFFLCSPLLVSGMIANNRRMVWVQIALVLLTLYLVTPPNVIKRKIKRTLLVLSPAIVAYFVIGWGSKAKFFKGAQIARSVVEPSTDASSLWREIENYDILFTFRQAPILGHGYGHPFWEVIPLPHVGYDLERYCPHNSILGLWAFAGYFGFTAFALLWASGAFFGMRAYRAAKNPIDRTAAVLATGSVIIYMIQCYGDMGLGAWTGVYLMAPSIALAGKLAVDTGAYPIGPQGKK